MWFSLVLNKGEEEMVLWQSAKMYHFACLRFKTSVLLGLRGRRTFQQLRLQN